MNTIYDQESDLKPIWNFLVQKTENTKDIVNEILVLHQKNELDTDFDELIYSMIHMLLNRLFISKQRMHELVVYDLLHSYYKSMIARNKKK